jgi:hypothetical protein
MRFWRQKKNGRTPQTEKCVKKRNTVPRRIFGSKTGNYRRLEKSFDWKT